MNIINSNETMFHVMLLVTLPPFLVKKCWEITVLSVCVCVHIHTHAFQLLNQLAGLHVAVYNFMPLQPTPYHMF
jgi:hypothetical protein